jgi:kynurenine formamidase
VIAELELDGARLRCDLSRPLDLSLAVSFDDSSARAFSLPRAEQAPFRAGAFVGDVREGGSVNCEVLQIAPHGNGTHTECVGHVVAERVSVDDVAPRELMLTRLLSVKPTTLADSGEAYGGACEDGDRVITRAALEPGLPAAERWPAVVVRTGAGDAAFSGANPPYFTDDAARLLREREVEHVLTDLPSLDREDDGGALAAHRIFFGLDAAQTSLDGRAPVARTVTELCRVPDDAGDGRYLLSLGVAPLRSDAAPSRPVLFALEDA